MAPFVRPPSLQMLEELTECKERWADVEDIGCSSPTHWNDYPVGVKPGLPDTPTVLWPDTPTATPIPHAAVCNLALPKMSLPFQQSQPMLAETGVQNASPANMSMILTHFAVPSQDGSALPMWSMQTGPSGCEAVPAPNADQIVQALQPWAGQPYNSNCAPPTNCYAIPVQWSSFAVPQASSAPESLSELKAWSTNAEDAGVPSESRVPPAAASDAELSPNKEALHNAGQCRPCAWFWRHRGCQNGDSCGYCHLCPEGELKSRKKSKVAAMRMGALAPVVDSGKVQSEGRWGLKLDELIKDASPPRQREPEPEKEPEMLPAASAEELKRLKSRKSKKMAASRMGSML